jgi:hypothetical protein
MVYFLGRDVSVTIAAGDDIGVTSNALVFADSATADFCNSDNVGLAVSDLTGVDLGIGVTDEDVTYIGSKTVLKAEIKKETTVSLTRKKSNNAWDVVFNDECRWGATNAAGGTKIVSLAEPDLSVTAPGGGSLYWGFQLKIHLATAAHAGAAEVFTVPHCQITAHTVTLNADGTTEETMEFVSQETPTIGAT